MLSLASSSPKRFRAGESMRPVDKEKLREERKENLEHRRLLKKNKNLPRLTQWDSGYNPKALTKEQDKVVRKIWYKDQRYWGRDRFYKVILSNKDEFGPGGMPSRRQVASWLRKQEVHQRYFAFAPDENVAKSIYTMKPGVVQIDVLDFVPHDKTQKTKHKYVFVAIDVFTHYMWAYVMKGKEAEDTSDALLSVALDAHGLGTPIKMLWSDKGSEFTADKFKEAVADAGIPKHMINPTRTHSHHVERSIKTLRALITKAMEEKGIGLTFWSGGQTKSQRGIDKLVAQYNDTWHPSIDMTPEEAIDADEEDVGATIASKAKVNEILKAPKFEVGDLVRVGIRKYKDQHKAGFPQFTRQVYWVSEVKDRKGTHVLYKVKELDQDYINDNYHEGVPSLKIDTDWYTEPRRDELKRDENFHAFLVSVTKDPHKENALVWANAIENQFGNVLLWPGEGENRGKSLLNEAGSKAHIKVQKGRDKEEEERMTKKRALNAKEQEERLRKEARGEGQGVKRGKGKALPFTKMIKS